MQVKKQQLELDMEQSTSSKLGKEYVKAVYSHPAYLTWMQSTSWETLGWKKHKLELRFPGEISITYAAKDGEALYSQQKQDQELTVAQIMNSLLPNSDLNWGKQGKLLDHSGMT